MAQVVDERDAVIETRGPADFRVHLWTGPAVAEKGACVAYDLLATDAPTVIAWATAAAEANSPCLAEVMLKVVRYDTGSLETIEIATIVHGEPGVVMPEVQTSVREAGPSTFVMKAWGKLERPSPDGLR